MNIFRYFKKLAALLGLVSASVLNGGCMQASEFFDRDMTQLLNTIVKQDRVRARELLDQGLDLNIHGQEGITPLIWLVMQKDKAAVQLAIELGADPDFPSDDGGSLVAMVAGGNDSELLQLLLDKGADPDSVDHNGKPALFPVVAYARKDQLDLMLAAGADINKTDKSNATPLNYAGSLRLYEMAYRLLMNNADHTIRDSTDGDIAWSVHTALEKRITAPESDQYPWLLKVRDILVERGVTFPPISPRQVRIKEGRPNKWDLEAMEKENKS